MESWQSRAHPGRLNQRSMHGTIMRPPATSSQKKPLAFIMLSAFLFGISLPLAKLLVQDISPVALAGLLYLGAFVGLSLYSLGRRRTTTRRDSAVTQLRRKDLPWLAGAVVSGAVAAPILLMTGLTLVSGFSASLLSNLEGVATAVIAVLVFAENAGRRLWLALSCMTAAGVFLTWDPARGGFTFLGPLLIVSAMVCWGIDNNLTRHISHRDPIQITRIKSLVGGTISLSLALALGLEITSALTIVLALLLGSFSYGVSLVFFIKALRGLGSFRTGAFFSLSPFIGAIASLIILREWIGWVIFPAAALLIAGVWLIYGERHSHMHLHEAVTHTHEHSHGDRHHLHEHWGTAREPHAHRHTHVELAHAHTHWPDTHHRHEHA